MATVGILKLITWIKNQINLEISNLLMFHHQQIFIMTIGNKNHINKNAEYDFSSPVNILNNNCVMPCLHSPQSL